MYTVSDSTGLKFNAWTYEHAIEWLKFCKGEAKITHRISGLVVAARAAQLI